MTLAFFNDFTHAISYYSSALNPAQKIKALRVSFQAPKLHLRSVSYLLNMSCEAS